MKINVTDVGIVQEIQIPGFTGLDLILEYDRLFKHLAGFMGTWIPPFKTYPATFWIRLQQVERLPPFTAKIVSYTPPPNPSRGLERRQATALLRNMKLRAPSTIEAFQAVTASFVTKFALFATIQKNCYRNLVALTPFHPEIPTFLQLSATLQNETFFKLQDHYDCGAKGRLFFSEHSPRKSFVSPMDTLTKHFPLLLGIEEGK